ncbi:hypothetical protein ACEWY4_022638 [Coilia grayii]|uniref:Transmembrane protein 179B n=1 Tax=Coilia grayii TaxID=363190 RepID=A0ABD1J2Q8_9TELE
MALWLMEFALHTSSFICGIVTAALVANVQARNQGMCLLYGTLQYNTSVQFVSVTSSSDPALCRFVTAISGSVAVFSLLQLLQLLCCVCACCGGKGLRGCPCGILTGVMCELLVFFLLITGCILKIGRDTLCRSLPQTHFNRCEDAQNTHWTIPNSGYQFYSHLHSAEICVWVSLCCLLVAGLLACVQQGRGSTLGPAETTPVLGLGPAETTPVLGHGPAETTPVLGLGLGQSSGSACGHTWTDYLGDFYDDYDV